MKTTDSIHVPVLLEEATQGLNLRAGCCVVDGTLGGGGHARRLASLVGQDGLVIGLDRDPAAIEHAETHLRGLPVVLANRSYADLPEVLAEVGMAADAVLLDLGLSSDQLADADRGFSFDQEGSLDMRFDPTAGEPAWRLLGRLSEEHLSDLIYEYGEERFSRRIAKRIVEHRRQSPIQTAAELARVIRSCVPRSRVHDIDPATRTFQALRIAVNHELDQLDIALRRIPDCLRPGGRFAIISFHSLEDRRAKHAFRTDERLRVITKKPIRPSAAELQRNPRSRSAKLRVAERL